MNDNNMHIRNMSSDTVVATFVSQGAFPYSSESYTLQTHLERQSRFAFVGASECTWALNFMTIIFILTV